MANLEEKLTPPAHVVCLTGAALNLLKIYDREFFPPISHHIGDFPLVITPIYLTGIIASGITNLGKKRNNTILQKARYLPEIIATTIATYFVLGESVCNIIPGNTMDPKDIPAVLIGAASSYIIAKSYIK